MYKLIKREKGDFVIAYWKDSDNIEVYVENDYYDPIKIYFNPYIEMSQEECFKYTKYFYAELESEVKVIINQNQEFYKNFDILFGKEFTGFSLGRNKINREKLIVSSATMYLGCKLKMNR